MVTLPYVTVDAFTTVKFRGNPAAVVVLPKENTADALDLRRRQAAKEEVVWTRGLMPARMALAGKDGFPPDTFLADVAREMHLSETAFVKMRPPPRQKKQPSAEGEADVAPSGTKSRSRVSFPFDDADSDRDARDEGVDGASTDPPSPVLSVVSRPSAGSNKKVDRDAVTYVEYDLRWFTRSGVEVDLCGHATLAAAHALYELGSGTVPDGAVVRFHTRGGVIPVARVEDEKRADDGAAFPKKKTTPLLELVLPCAPPRLAALGGKDVAPAGDDDSDDDDPPTVKTGEENEAGDEKTEGGGKDGDADADARGVGAKTSSETFGTPAEAGVFFRRGDAAAALGVRARDVEAIVGRNALGDVFVCLVDHAALRRCVPDAPLVRFLTKNGRGLVACAPGGAVAGDDGAPVDFSCRFFGPNIGIDEDPVPGSAFCGGAPDWHTRLGRKNGEERVAHQASARGGVVRVAAVKKRGGGPGAADETEVRVRGRAVSVLKGEILSDGFEAERA